MEGIQKLEHLAADLQRWQEDLKENPNVNAKQELMMNAIPFMLGIVRACHDELLEQSGVIVELVESEMDDHAELAAMIVTVIETGRAICRTIKNNDYKLDNDIVSGQMKKAIEEYDHNAVVTLNRVREVLVEEWEDDEDDEDQTSGEPSESEEEDETDEDTQDTEDEEGSSEDQPQEEEVTNA